MFDFLGYPFGFVFIVGVLGACFFTLLGYRISEVRRWDLNAIVLVVTVATAVFVAMTLASLAGLAGEQNSRHSLVRDRSHRCIAIPAG